MLLCVQTSIFTTLFCALAAACCGTLTQIFLKVVSMIARTFIESGVFDKSKEVRSMPTQPHPPPILSPKSFTQPSTSVSNPRFVQRYERADAANSRSPSSAYASTQLVPFLVAACLMGCTAACQMYLINATMASGKVIIAVPSYSSLTIVLTITGSAIFYGDFESLGRDNITYFAVGVAIVALGIILLSVLQWCRYQRQGLGARKKPGESDQLLSRSKDPRQKADLRSLGESSTGSKSSPASVSGDSGVEYRLDGAESSVDGSSAFGGSRPTHYSGSVRG